MTPCYASQTIIFILYYITFPKVSSDVMPTTLRLVEGDSMYLWWTASSSLSSCSVATPLGTSTPLSDSGGTGHVTYWGAGWAQGVCGVRVVSVRSGVDNGTWILSATGQTTAQRSTNVIINQASVVGTRRNVSVELEQYLLVQCGPDDGVLYCELTSPYNQTTVLRLKPCQLTVSSVQQKHAGLWSCRYLLRYQSFQAHATTLVNVITDTANFVVGQNETETELNIFCSHPKKPIQTMAYCSILPPNGAERMTLAPGQGLSRYHYYGFAAYHCGVAIKKPLQTEEYGPWLCEMVYTSGDHKGGYIYVKNNRTKRSVPVQPLQTLSSVKVVLANKESLVVSCAVPSSLVYCWLQHPNGSVFSPYPNQVYAGYKYSGQGYDFGECGMLVASPSVNDSGQWTCGMGLQTDDGDVSSHELTTKVDVVVSVLPLMPHKSTVQAPKGGSVTVGCELVQPQAVTYCRFWKPDKTGLTIDSVTNYSSGSPGKYSYVGAGLSVGDCSLLVTGVQADDFGTWVCAISLAPFYLNRGGELTTDFQIVEERKGVSAAAAVGILAGVMLAVLGVAIVAVFYRRRSKAKLRNSDEPLFPTSRLEDVQSEAGSSVGTTTSPVNTQGVKITKKKVIFQRRNQIS